MPPIYRKLAWGARLEDVATPLDVEPALAISRQVEAFFGDRSRWLACVAWQHGSEGITLRMRSVHETLRWTDVGGWNYGDWGPWQRQTPPSPPVRARAGTAPALVQWRRGLLLLYRGTDDNVWGLYKRRDDEQFDPTPFRLTSTSDVRGNIRAVVTTTPNRRLHVVYPAPQGVMYRRYRAINPAVQTAEYFHDAGIDGSSVGLARNRDASYVALAVAVPGTRLSVVHGEAQAVAWEELRWNGPVSDQVDIAGLGGEFHLLVGTTETRSFFGSPIEVVVPNHFALRYGAWFSSLVRLDAAPEVPLHPDIAPTLVAYRARLIAAYADGTRALRVFSWNAIGSEPAWEEEDVPAVSLRSRPVLAVGGRAVEQEVDDVPLESTAEEECYATFCDADGHVRFGNLTRMLFEGRLRALNMSFRASGSAPGGSELRTQEVRLAGFADEDFAELPIATAYGYATWLMPAWQFQLMAFYYGMMEGRLIRVRLGRRSNNVWTSKFAGIYVRPLPRSAHFHHEFHHDVFRALGLYGPCLMRRPFPDPDFTHWFYSCGPWPYDRHLFMPARWTDDATHAAGEDLFDEGVKQWSTGWPRVPLCGVAPPGDRTTPYDTSTCVRAGGFFGVHTSFLGCNYDCTSESHSYIYALQYYLGNRRTPDGKFRDLPFWTLGGRKYTWLRRAIFGGAEFEGATWGLRRDVVPGDIVGTRLPVAL